MAVENIVVDFEILPTSDPKKLKISDDSTWAHIADKPAIIEITLPNEKMVTHYLSPKNNVLVFNSSNLYLSESTDKALPDGIYKITVKGSPDTFQKTRSYIRTVKLQLDIDKLYLKDGLDTREEIIKLASKIDFLIKAADAAMRQDQKQKAVKFYKEAKKLYDDYERCKDC